MLAALTFCAFGVGAGASDAAPSMRAHSPARGSPTAQTTLAFSLLGDRAFCLLEFQPRTDGAWRVPQLQ